MQVDSFIAILLSSALVKLPFKAIKVGLLILTVFALKARLMAPLENLLILLSFVQFECAILCRLVGARLPCHLSIEIPLKLTPSLGHSIYLDLVCVLPLWLPSLGFHCRHCQEALTLDQPWVSWVEHSRGEWSGLIRGLVSHCRIVAIEDVQVYVHQLLEDDLSHSFEHW